MGVIPPDGLAVPAGHLAVIVTDLEMGKRPALRPLPPSDLRLSRWKSPEPDKYRALFRRVGAPWLWFSRLGLSDAELIAETHDSAVEVHAVLDRKGIEVGLLEIDARENPEVEIKYLGLVPELAGKGHGQWLMAQALMLAWKPGVSCVWLHTCTLDHPNAMPIYIRAGFTPVSREVQMFPDPRLSGLLPEDAAPHIPLIRLPSA